MKFGMMENLRDLGCLMDNMEGEDILDKAREKPSCSTSYVCTGITGSAVIESSESKIFQGERTCSSDELCDGIYSMSCLREFEICEASNIGGA